MNWAIYTMMFLTVLGLGMTIGQDEKEKTGNNSVWWQIISITIWWGLLYFGGIFK